MIVLDPVAVTDAVLTSTNVPDGFPTWVLTDVYGLGEHVVDPANHNEYQMIVGTSSVVSITVASPAVITWAAHGLIDGASIKLSTTGVLPTGLVAGVTYFVKSPGSGSFNLSATVGGAAIATTGGQSGTHTAVANLIGLSPHLNPTRWLLVGASNSRKMFDVLNNTQTTNADAIVVALTPHQIAGGAYLGGLDANEVVLLATDPVEGVVLSRTESLIQSTSGSSFFRWCFGRIQRKNFFLALDLPMYLNATVQLSINKAGGIAKCGMCAIGPLIDLGFSQYGIGREDKDYSSTRFDVDGTSESTLRGYSKIMTIDVEINNDVIDGTIETLSNYRQRNVVWIGASEFGHTVVFGKYSSFKNVLAYFAISRMALKIDGTV